MSKEDPRDPSYMQRERKMSLLFLMTRGNTRRDKCLFSRGEFSENVSMKVILFYYNISCFSSVYSLVRNPLILLKIGKIC